MAAGGTLDGAFSRLDDELRRVAARHMRGQRRDHTLSPTALVNEAYLKLKGSDGALPSEEVRLLGLASHAMRQILVDHARGKARAKRGGDGVRVALAEQPVAPAGNLVDLLALDEAITRLAALSERKGRLVEMRCFGGMTLEQCADALDVARSTVTEDWRFIRAWMRREIYGSDQR